MTDELVLLLVRLNLSLTAAIFLVLLLRAPIRRWCGADLAYNLWVLPPVALLGDIVASFISFAETGRLGGLMGSLRAPVLPDWAGEAWATGALGGLALMAATHIYALVQMRRGKLGPAVVGLIRPRLCLPRDFGDKFTPSEQRLIRAHERVHMERNDVLANTLFGVFRCAMWFNPVVHLAAMAIKQDQELACDAQVMDVFPDQRRRYAAAMLKAGAGPAGVCAFGTHPLSIRITAIVRGEPLPHPRVIGILFMGFCALSIIVLYASSFGNAPTAETFFGPYAANYIPTQEPAPPVQTLLALRP